MEYVFTNPKYFLKNTDKRIINKIKEYIPEELHKHAPKLILYIINSPKQMSILFKQSMHSAVIPSRFIDNHFDPLRKMKSNGIPFLVDLGVVSRSNYQRATENTSGLCREYGVDTMMFLELMLFAHSIGKSLHTFGNVEVPVSDILKNPVTNHPAALDQSPDTHMASVSDMCVVLNPSSPLYSVMKYNFKNVIRIRDVDDYCVKRYQNLLSRKAKLLAKNPKRFYSEARSIKSDWDKYTSLVLRGMTDTDGIFKYARSFMITSTGRLCETAGGIQGLSRGCKTYIYKDVEDLNNYDIKASQLTLLSHFCKQIHINTKWIDDYVSMDDAKSFYAQRVGISKDAWKKTILSMVFGGLDNNYGTPYQTILKDKGGNKHVAEQCFIRWKQETEGLRVICKLWLTRIRKFAKDNSTNNILENAVGIQVNLKDITVNRKFLSSFLLQGLESKILSDLILYPTDEYEVVSPEFDGLVVVGEISEDIWKKVLTPLSLSDINLKLERKSFS